MRGRAALAAAAAPAFALSIVLEADRFVEGGGGEAEGAELAGGAADGEAGGAADEDEGGRWLELGERSVEREEERVRGDRDGGGGGRLRLRGARLVEGQPLDRDRPRRAERRGAAQLDVGAEAEVEVAHPSGIITARGAAWRSRASTSDARTIGVAVPYQRPCGSRRSTRSSLRRTGRATVAEAPTTSG